MSVLGSYSVGGSFSSITLSYQYSTVDELLTGLVDNSTGLIKAGNIRDSVFTLWEKVDSLAATVSTVATVSVDYNRSTPSLVSVGGLPIGSTFSGTIQDVLDRILYPYVAPSGSLSPSYNYEYGNPSGYSFTLNWSVVKNSNVITSITANSVSQLPTGNSQSGTVAATGTHSSINPSVSTTNTYLLSVSDSTSTTNVTSTVVWKNRIYWGRIDLTSIGNPNLTTSPGSSTIVSSLVNSSLILGLNGAGANGAAYGSELSDTKSKTYTNIDGQGKYLIFAWPSNVSGAYSPTFTVNGLPSSAFTRVKNNWALTNQFGFNGSDYEVWVSNTQQNSPLTVVVS